MCKCVYQSQRPPSPLALRLFAKRGQLLSQQVLTSVHEIMSRIMKSRVRTESGIHGELWKSANTFSRPGESVENND